MRSPDVPIGCATSHGHERGMATNEATNEVTADSPIPIYHSPNVPIHSFHISNADSLVDSAVYTAVASSLSTQKPLVLFFDVMFPGVLGAEFNVA